MSKFCHNCEQEKDIKDFYSNGYTPNGAKKYKPNCKPCEQKLQLAKHYDKIISILEDQGRVLECKICGYNHNWAALTFHHKTDEKNFEISSSKTRNREDLDYEIYICDLLCHNCHMESHYPHLEI